MEKFIFTLNRKQRNIPSYQTFTRQLMLELHSGMSLCNAISIAKCGNENFFFEQIFSLSCVYSETQCTITQSIFMTIV